MENQCRHTGQNNCCFCGQLIVYFKNKKDIVEFGKSMNRNVNCRYLRVSMNNLV